MGSEHHETSGDRYLIEEIRGGSSIAFKQLVDRFGGRLRAFASRQLTGSGLDPDDAVQETFLSLVRGIEKLDDVRSLQAYLFTILRCRIADLARSRGPTAGAVSLDAVESTAGFEPPSPGNTPSTYARQDEAVEARPQVLGDTLDELLSHLKNERKFRDLKILTRYMSDSGPLEADGDVMGRRGMHGLGSIVVHVYLKCSEGGVMSVCFVFCRHL